MGMGLGIANTIRGKQTDISLLFVDQSDEEEEEHFWEGGEDFQSV